MPVFKSKQSKVIIKCPQCGNSDLSEGETRAGSTEYKCEKCGHIDYFMKDALEKV